MSALHAQRCGADSLSVPSSAGCWMPSGGGEGITLASSAWDATSWMNSAQQAADPLVLLRARCAHQGCACGSGERKLGRGAPVQQRSSRSAASEATRVSEGRLSRNIFITVAARHMRVNQLVRCRLLGGSVDICVLRPRSLGAHLSVAQCHRPLLATQDRRIISKRSRLLSFLRSNPY